MMKRRAGQTRIALYHPLCRGLVGGWLFNETTGGLVTLPQLNPNDQLTLTNGSSGGIWTARPGSGIVWGTGGVGAWGQGGGAKLTSPSAALQPTDIVSFFWYGTVSGGGNLANNPVFLGMGYAPTNTSPFFAWGIHRKNTGGADLLVLNDYGGTNNGFTITSQVAVSANPVSYAASFKSGSQLVYKNGIQVGSGSNTGSLSYSSPTLFVASDYNNEDPALLTSMVLIWHRFLSAAEHLALASNPFQILVPSPRPPRAAIAPAPPVPYPNWWTDIQMPQLLPQ